MGRWCVCWQSTVLNVTLSEMWAGAPQTTVWYCIQSCWSWVCDWHVCCLFCFSVTNHLWHNQTMTSQWLAAVCVCGSVAFVYSVIKWFENSLPTLSLSKWSGVISSRFQMHAWAQVNRQINTKLAKYKSTVFDTLQKSFKASLIFFIVCFQKGGSNCNFFN